MQTLLAFLANFTVKPWVIITLFVIFALAVTYKLVKAFRPLFHRVGHFLDDYFGEDARPGVPARKGLMVRMSDQDTSLAAQETRLDAVEHELKKNSGLSLRDQTNRLEFGQQRLVATINQFALRLGVPPIILPPQPPPPPPQLPPQGS